MRTRTRAASERRLAALAAYVGGAATAASALGVGVLFGQAVIARLTIPGAEAPPPRCSGTYGRRYEGQPLRLAMLGDSTAAGYGVSTAEQTPGALLATWLADAAQRPVVLTCPAVVGSLSAWLGHQVEIALERGVDIAVIIIGANDVTARQPIDIAVAHLARAVRELRAAGAEVVVATCPDLGTVRPIMPPLRWIARRLSRRLAAAQTVAVVEAGGRTVALGDLLGPQFHAAPERMFGADRYHPSAEGYRAAAEAIFPAILSAAGLGPEPVSHAPSLPVAAAAAVERPGTNLSPAGLAANSRAATLVSPRWWRWARRRAQDLVPHPATGLTRAEAARTGR